ncbi:hypothetical protein NPX13_g4952 [Xylaria arbuscula]|uniref:Uncharacterized protein n=1 Tax=Xylaria arbuscula TaxID=114810 RepID=A0A9W8TLR3_9PEZI|nr:hypothetical protein NPX13_g4952 [Xylaria arbuscula]
MAPAIVTAVPPPLPPKIKRPPVQTNGAPSQQSSSPSISAKKPPPVTASRQNQPLNSTNAGANGVAGTSNRPTAPRSRRDTVNASGVRGQKNSSALRPNGIDRDMTMIQLFGPRPEGLAA